MSDDSPGGKTRPAGAKAFGASIVAAEGLAEMAARIARPSATIDHGWVERLAEASTSSLPEAASNLIQEMKAKGLPDEEIADLYIPAVARQLGEDWCQDSVSFVDVSVGTARLQALLRQLGQTWSVDEADFDPGLAGWALVIIAQDVHHTLGAMVLCGQLRRLGLSVRLAIGSDSDDLAEIVTSHNFRAVMISASAGEDLAPLRRIVRELRKKARHSPSIIVGGTVLDQGKDIAGAIGADHQTSDVLEALALCGISAEFISHKKTHQTENQDG